MNDKLSLIASAVLVVFFLVCGLLNILDNLVIMVLLFGGFFFLVLNILVTQSKKEEEQKNPSE